MRFGPWYPLADARDHSPATEGVWQVRLASGLVDYPRGKSAMVHYGHARDVRAAAMAWAEARGAAALVCRHLIELGGAPDLAGLYARYVEDFVRRFGVAPRWQPALGPEPSGEQLGPQAGPTGRR